MKAFRSKRPVVAVRAVHLDLKGLPPTPRRLLQLLDLFAEMKLNAVLVEWEDTYPWRYSELRCATAYSPTVVRRFLKRARVLGIEIIPLIQSFGHMENVLARSRFRKLRESPDSAGDLCPSHPGSQAIVREMLEDILSTHTGYIRRIHLGGDEVAEMGVCPKCRKVAEKSGKAELYVRHILPLLDFAQSRGLQPLLWDDMMRRWPMAELRKLAGKTDLVCWQYRADPFENVSSHALTRRVMGRFQKAGITLWGASAFKGADGSNVDMANLEIRRKNLLAWAEEARRRQFAGLMATGWSRYNTFAVPCESLESSLVSLYLAAASMWDGALAPDAEKQALVFLNSGRRKALAGKRNEQCFAASRELAAWRDRLDGSLRVGVRSASIVSGESDRINRRAEDHFRKTWTQYLEHGRETARVWRQAHRGRVPELWLDHYIQSRLWIPEQINRTALRELLRKG